MGTSVTNEPPKVVSDSSEYFGRVADRWDEMRSGYFSEAMRDAAIAKAALPPGAVVADIGTGTGFVAEALAHQARHVFGFDASPAMLAVAGRNLSGLSNVTLRQAEGQTIPLSDGSLDAVFANMYLHHAPDPAAAIREMARLLKPGGVLCITDLDSHPHAWFREQMADLWLGFRRDEVREWYAEAGLAGIDVDCAAGTCDSLSPGGERVRASVFVAIGRKPG
ncbi:MAG: class I SAM-dependent methyltransferase [Rudaea sp.]